MDRKTQALQRLQRKHNKKKGIVGDEDFVKILISDLLFHKDFTKESFDIIFQSFMKMIDSDPHSFKSNYMEFNKNTSSLYKLDAQTRILFMSTFKDILANKRANSIKEAFLTNTLKALMTPHTFTSEQVLEILPTVLDSKPPYSICGNNHKESHEVWDICRKQHFVDTKKRSYDPDKYIETMHDENNPLTKIIFKLIDYSAERKLVEKGICDSELNLDQSKLRDLAEAAIFLENGPNEAIYLYVNRYSFPQKWCKADQNKEDFLSYLKSISASDAEELAPEKESGLEVSFLKDALTPSGEISNENLLNAIVKLSPKGKAQKLALDIKYKNFQNIALWLSTYGFCDKALLEYALQNTSNKEGMTLVSLIINTNQQIAKGLSITKETIEESLSSIDVNMIIMGESAAAPADE